LSVYDRSAARSQEIDKEERSMAKLNDYVPGVKFPDLELPDHSGRPVHISDFTNNGRDPVCLIFYRGWY
jgi:hypothetical protein